MGRRIRSPYRSGSLGRTLWLPLALALAGVVVTACTVKPIGWQPSAGTGSGANGGGVFDAKAYVTSIWSSQVLPTFDAKSVDAATLIAALAADPAAAEKKYGNQAADNGPYSFMVKGSGKVLEAGADGLAVDLAPPDGKADVTINVGPVILGTALRDAVGFIKFNDFTNQIDYAQVSTEMKNEVKSTVLASFNATGAVGKTVDFEGAFALTDTTSMTAASIVIVPVRLSVGNGQ
jgi:predicted lipoprotein